jgi:cell pole-organizing protein PopZ/acetolactate synthase regulatory subunit
MLECPTLTVRGLNVLAPLAPASIPLDVAPRSGPAGDVLWLIDIEGHRLDVLARFNGKNYRRALRAVAEAGSTMAAVLQGTLRCAQGSSELQLTFASVRAVSQPASPTLGDGPALQVVRSDPTPKPEGTFRGPSAPARVRFDWLPVDISIAPSVFSERYSDISRAIVLIEGYSSHVDVFFRPGEWQRVSESLANGTAGVVLLRGRLSSAPGSSACQGAVRVCEATLELKATQASEPVMSPAKDAQEDKASTASDGPASAPSAVCATFRVGTPEQSPAPAADAARSQVASGRRAHRSPRQARKPRARGSAAASAHDFDFEEVVQQIVAEEIRARVRPLLKAAKRLERRLEQRPRARSQSPVVHLDAAAQRAGKVDKTATLLLPGQVALGLLSASELAEPTRRRAFEVLVATLRAEIQWWRSASVPVLVFRRLVELSRNTDRGGWFLVDRTKLAAQLRRSRGLVSTVVHDWVRRGLLEQSGRRLRIRDLDQLRFAAEEADGHSGPTADLISTHSALLDTGIDRDTASLLVQRLAKELGRCAHAAERRESVQQLACVALDLLQENQGGQAVLRAPQERIGALAGLSRGFANLHLGLWEKAGLLRRLAARSYAVDREALLDVALGRRVLKVAS